MNTSEWFLEVAPRIGLGAAVIATIVGIIALVSAVRRSETTLVPAIAALALGAIAPALGLVALSMALHAGDGESAHEGRGTRARNAFWAHEDGTKVARDGAIAAVAPLLLGTVALVAARKRRAASWIAAALSVATAGAAWLGASKPGPADPGEQRARLMDARDLVDVDRARGCDALAKAVKEDYAFDPTKGPLPPEVRATVPDYATVATKCARWAFAEHKLPVVAESSPLLVDDALREEVANDVDLHPCGFGCGGDDDVGGYGTIGVAPKRNAVRFVTAERTETGPTDYRPEVLLAIVGRARTRIRLRSCPETAPGNVTVTLTVERSGKVVNVASTPAPSATAGPPIGDAAVVACVVKAMEALTFPPPEGTVTITFPIGFDRLK